MVVFVCLAILFGYIWKYGLFGYGLGSVLCVLHGDAPDVWMCAADVRAVRKPVADGTAKLRSVVCVR